MSGQLAVKTVPVYIILTIHLSPGVSFREPRLHGTPDRGEEDRPMSNRDTTVWVGHLIKGSEQRVQTGSGWGYSKTYSSFKTNILRPEKGTSYLPLTCSVCGQQLKLRVMSKFKELAIRLALAVFGIAGLCVGLLSRADPALRYFLGIGGGLAFVFTFMRKEQFAVRLVSDKPDNSHVLLFKKY